MRFNLDAPTRGGLMSAVGILLIVQVSLSVEVSSPEQTKPQEQISSKPESSVNINLGQSEGTSPVSSSSLLIESSIESFPQVQTKLTNVVEKTFIAENLSSSSPSSSTSSGTSSISSSSTSSGTSDKKEVSSEGSLTSSESLTVTSDGSVAPKDVSEEKLEKRDEQTETSSTDASSADALQDKPSASSSPVISTSVSASLGSSSASVSATPSLQSTTTSQTSEDPIPTRFPEDDLLGLSVEYEPINDALKKIDPRMGTPQSVYKVVPTASLQAIEMTTATYHNINPNRVGLIDETNHEDHFLVNRASHNSNKGGPLNPATRSSDDDIRRPNNDDISKRPRNNDRGDSVPAINDILSGLLSVVGEGLNFATNYVQENNKRKQEQQQQQQLQPQQNEIPLQINNNNKLFPSRNRTRVNNRGPPRISEIPFEAIPLEVQSLGGKPIQIQRPFGLPGGLRPPNFGQERPQGPPPRRPPPSNSLFPKRPDASPAPPLPTRPDYEPGFLRPESEENKDDDSLPDKEDDLLSLEELYQFKGDQKNNAESLGNSAPDHGNTAPDVGNTEPDVGNTASDRGNTMPDRGNILQNDIRRPTAPPTRTPSSTPPPPTQLASSPGPEIQSSFGASPPPFLVTPPATQKKRRPFNRRRPPRPDGRPNRPPRPDGRPLNRPQTSVATPPLNSRPQAATRPTGVPNVVTGIAVPADSNIVTGIAIPAENEIFDITVTAQQGFGSRPTKQKYKNFDGIITKARPGDQFVSIDGKRTYFDLGATNTAARPAVKPTRPVVGRGGVIGATLKIGGENVLPAGRPNYKPYTPVGAAVQQLDFREAGSTTRRATTTQPNPGPTRRPLAPPVRIDTCIVGDNTTCKDNATEVCRTYLGVSSCYCKPGFGRKSHRLMCKRTVKLLLSLKLDRIQDTPLSWSREYRDPNSEKFQVLEGEASYAIDSAMALTSFSNLYMGNSISTFYPLNKAVTVNTTMEMIENGYTTSQIVKRDLEQKLVQVIQARGNNIGNGNLYVAGLFNPIPDIRDFNECAEPLSNDCGDNSVCINTFGGFTCECKQGYGDRFSADERRSGRECTSCPQEYCSNRGVCSFLQGEQVCTCEGNYYGDKCEVDGEVLAVAIGASVAAVVIIILTLVCLCMWSRRWKREQEKVEMSRGYNRPYIVGTLPPPPSYTLPPASSYHPAKVPGWGPQPSPAYPPRWTNHVDAQQNIYAPVVYNGSQEPLYMSPTEPPMSIYGTAPPPTHRPVGQDGQYFQDGGQDGRYFQDGRQFGAEGHYGRPASRPVSIYGTLPRGTRRVGASEFSPFPFQYATWRKDTLSSRPSLKSLGLMEGSRGEDNKAFMEDRDGFEEDRDGFEEGSESTNSSGISLKEKLTEENFNKITRGVTFQALRANNSVINNTNNINNINRANTNISRSNSNSNHNPQPEPGARRVINPGGRSTLRGPLPSLPRPSTALGTRGGSTLLLESESDDTENSGRLPRPRSSMMAGNLNADDDFESEYLRYGGTVGVRNPRLVAAMRGVPPYQQHIQMNMINRF